MLGWEFPPFFAGGVGMVCYELVKAFAKRGDVDITYIMPYGPKDLNTNYVKLLVADNIVPNSKITLKIRKISSLLGSYMSPEEYTQQLKQLQTKRELQTIDSDTELSKDNTHALYGANIIAEAYRFAEKVRLIAQEEEFDVIHAHDWTTFPAAIAVKELTGKPLIVHIHITEFNKSGGHHANPQVYAIEQEGMRKADAVIAISNLIKNMCVEKYFIDPSKIHVIHNANIEMDPIDHNYNFPIRKHNQIVLFAGRVTLQKGADYFVEAARKVCTVRNDVKFIMAGAGDMLQRMIDRVGHLGLADKFIFHGFYSREDAEKFFSMADVFVMPSVSEPFGVVPLEAMSKGTPAIISKQSGVSEILNNVLKVDFWDVDELANKIIALLNYKALHTELRDKGLKEVQGITWDVPAAKCVDLYNKLLGEQIIVRAR